MAFPPLSTAAAPAKTAPVLAEGTAALQSLPDQAERLTVDLVRWVRTDSLAVVAGGIAGLVLYAALLLLRRWAVQRLEHGVIFGSFTWIALKVGARTRAFFLLMVAAKVTMTVFGAPGTWWSFVHVLFTIAATVQGAVWAQELLLALIERRTTPEADPLGNISSAYGILKVLIAAVVWALAAIILLDNLGVNVTALVAGLGIGGIAIGLAAQGIFSDLFAALSILFDQPFRRGDTIQIGGATGVVGTVEHIGLKTTRLRALSGEVVVLSNANILSQQINNFADYNHRRVVMRLSVIYQTPVETLASIPDELKTIVDRRPKCRFDRAHFVAFAASSLDFEMVFFVTDPSLLVMMEEQHAVGLAILERFAELQIDFAYPSQVSFMAGRDGRIVDPGAADPAFQAALKKM